MYSRDYQLQVQSRRISSNPSPGQFTVSRASLLSLAENVHYWWQPSPVKKQLSNINKGTIYQHALQLSAHDIIFKIKFKCFSNRCCSFKVCLYQTHQFYLKLTRFSGKILDIKPSFVGSFLKVHR